MAENNSPAAKDGDIAVFAHDDSNGNTHYTVVDGPKNSPERKSVDVYGLVGPVQLSAEEVLEIYKGNDVVIDGIPQKNDPEKTYSASIAARGIAEKPWARDGKEGVNLSLRVGMALHNISQKGEMYGYSISTKTGEKRADGRDEYKLVNYFNSVGPKGSPVELSAGDCLKIADGQNVIKGGLDIAMTGIEVSEDGKRSTAKVFGEIINKKEAATQEPESEAAGVGV